MERLMYRNKTALQKPALQRPALEKPPLQRPALQKPVPMDKGVARTAVLPASPAAGLGGERMSIPITPGATRPPAAGRGYSDRELMAYVSEAQAASGQAMPAYNLPGVAADTQASMDDLLAGYTPSEAVNEAERALDAIVAQRPGEFSSQYTSQLEQIMGQINGRSAFSYDPANDPMYQMYKDQYTQGGRMAMMDTMGQAAALSGGYGSSYASTVGNQAYQGYLTQLNNVLPELRGQALEAYNAEGNRLTTAYGMASDAYARDKEGYDTRYGQWQDGRDYASGRYDSTKQYDYSDYTNRLGSVQNLANQQNAQYNSDRALAYQTVMNMLKIGKMPSAQLLASAGLSAADAKKFYDKYK